MRRTAVSALVPLLILAACGSDGATSSPSAPATEVASTPAPVATEAPPTTDPPTTDPPPATEAPAATDAPAPSEPAIPALEIVQPGPYRVGVQTIEVTDQARDRTLTVDVWFPVVDDAGGAPHRYTLLSDVYYESPAAIDATAADIAPDGPYPLVVYSHGSGGLRYIASYYTEMIASHGYIVAAPDHIGNTVIDRLAGTEVDGAVTALARPQDVAAVIDAMTDPENPTTGGFVGALDPERVAVTGHSFGGFTAYAMVSGFDNELGSFEPDPRVDAIIPLAPAVGSGDDALLSDARLASITTPSLVMVGTNDQTTPVDPNVTRVWELTASIPHRRVELVDAQHQSFTDLCDYQDFLPTLADVPQIITDTVAAYAVEGCSPGDMPIDRAKELASTFAVNFLESMFRESQLYRPDTVQAPADVVFQAK